MNHGYLVYSAYIRPSNLGHQTFAAHIYAPQTSSGFSSRVVYMRNTPRNHDLYISYKSWLPGVFHVYVLKTSKGRGFWVVYTRNTPGNHDLCKIYTIRLVQRRHLLPSGVYVIHTTCASIGQWPPLAYIHVCMRNTPPNHDLCNIYTTTTQSKSQNKC